MKKSGRKNLIYNFPISFWQDQHKNLKDNELVQNVRLGDINKQTAIKALTVNLAGMGRERTDDLTANWDALLSGEGTAKISDNLLAYMLTRFGFTWNPTSATGLASTDAKRHFGKGKYQDIFVDDELWSDSEVFKFLVQYARNNPKSSLWAKSTNYPVKEEKGILTVDKDTVPKTFIGVNHQGNLYVRASSIDGNKDIFVPVSKLGVQSKKGNPILFELDANADAEGTMGLGDRKLITAITKANNEAQRARMNIASKALLENESEEEEDEDGEEGLDTNNPSMEKAKKLVGSFAEDYPTINAKISEEAIMSVLDDDDSAYVNFLKEIVDIISENKEFKANYKSLLKEVKDLIKTLCS